MNKDMHVVEAQPLLVAGPLVAWIVGALEGEVVIGGLSVLGAGLISIGIPKDSVLEYETAMRSDKILLLVNGTVSEVAKAKEILDTTQPAKLHLHSERELLAAGQARSKGTVVKRWGAVPASWDGLTPDDRTHLILQIVEENLPLPGQSLAGAYMPKGFRACLGSHFRSSLRIDFNSCRRFGVVLGYAIFRSSNVSRTIRETISRAFSLSSEGTAYQGA